MDFKEQLKNEFIPRIKDMLEKEKNHFTFLKESRTKLKTLPSTTTLFGSSVKLDFNDEFNMDKLISQSQWNLTLLEMRLVEYNEYLNKN